MEFIYKNLHKKPQEQLFLAYSNRNGNIPVDYLQSMLGISNKDLARKIFCSFAYKHHMDYESFGYLFSFFKCYNFRLNNHLEINYSQELLLSS